jgi:nucleotide-binding universal stress UspA family protein
MAYKRILVAVDGSETSVAALKEAIKLANEFKATLRIINVADEFLGYIEGLSIDLDKYTKSIQQYSQSILKTMQDIARKSGIDAETEVIEITDVPARVPEKIIEDARKWKADIIVVGTHGRSGFGRMILGSVADGVIRHAVTPVLLVRSEEKS